MPGESTVEVVTAALDTERRKWVALADDLSAVQSNVDRLTLDVTAFFCGDPTSMSLAPTYEKFRSYLAARLAEGQTEFGEIAGALQRIADDYDGSDEVSAARLDSYYGRFDLPGEVEG